MVYARTNILYADFRTKGVQPFHMKVWYVPESEGEIRELIEGIEALAETETQEP